MPVVLLFLFSISLSIGTGIVVMVIRRARQKRSSAPRIAPSGPEPAGYDPGCIYRRPVCWLAIKSRRVLAVQSALGLNNAKPCSWTDGLTGHQKLFIAPPVKGWILVVGSDLPDPSEDEDACFRFIQQLSRRLGQVQFFQAVRAVQYHAWIKADSGKIVRAYAWAGRTLWCQGAPTSAEKELDLKMFGYTEAPERVSFTAPDVLFVNTEKVPLLAARWSLDPGRIDLRCLETECGVAGTPSRRF
jgi:hypothetical protein